MQKRLILARWKQKKYRDVLEGWTLDQVLALPAKEQAWLLQYADELTGRVRKGKEKLNNWRFVKDTRAAEKRERLQRQNYITVSYEDWRREDESSKEETDYDRAKPGYD